MTKIEILTQQAKNYADEFLMEQLDMATDADEVRVLELEMDSRTSPYLAADSSRSLLGDLLGGASLFGGAR
jgi:hypothetical protein